MTLTGKLEAYRNALHRWRAAHAFLKSHPVDCPRNQQPNPRDYGLNSEIELTMANTVLQQALSLLVYPEKTLENTPSMGKR